MNGFSNIVGHEQIKEHLQAAIKKRNPFHAYIFEGESGIGKKQMAHAFSAGLQCSAEGEHPCGSCVSCRQEASGLQPDIIWLRKEKSSYGVDEIREQLNHAMPIKPYASKYKIFIISEADTMTEQAQDVYKRQVQWGWNGRNF